MGRIVSSSQGDVTEFFMLDASVDLAWSTLAQ